MRLGDLTIHILSDTTFRLDGGAMFGVVPKALWSRVKPSDDENRIQMTSHCLVVESGDGVALVDTGLGEKLDAKGLDRFAVPRDQPRLLERLEGKGLRPEDVDHVICTHLHFDHCGWNTRSSGEEWVPTFPEATYWIQRAELAHARNPNVRDRPSYDSRNFEPLMEAGVVELFDDDVEPIPGVRAVRAPGHTEGMCVVVLDGGHESRKAVFLADLVPTAAHVPTPWVMGYDLFPVTTMTNKDQWLPRAAEQDWVCIFQHDPEVPAARLVEERPGRYRAEPLDPETLQ